MIQFDKKTLEKWKSEGITSVSVFFYESGCAGTKVHVTLQKENDCDREILHDAIRVFVKEEEFSLIDNSTITLVGKKWIFTSKKINTRCGCGSSFSLKSENPLHDKIAQMKLAMKQKREGVHK